MPLYEEIIAFFSSLSLNDVKLPSGISVMNPFKGPYAAVTKRVMGQFYQKFYSDNKPRRMILGINPGKSGAGLTGLMFTDTIRLNKDCGIELQEFHSRELSSDFFYQVIEKYGGVNRFYEDFYISAVSPLGFIRKNDKGTRVNCNYYDNKELQRVLLPFIQKTLLHQLKFNIRRDVCFCLGTGKNFSFLHQLNNEMTLFEKIVPLDHPRYILQYKRKQVDEYITMYLEKFFNQVNN